MTGEFNELVLRAVQSLLAGKGEHWDDEGEQGAGLLKTLEALEAILIPINQLGIDYTRKGDLPAIVLKTVNGVLADFDTKGWAPDPYLTQEIQDQVKTRLHPRDTACVDVASFALSTLMDVGEYIGGKGVEPEKIKDFNAGEIKKWAERAARWLSDNSHFASDDGVETHSWGWGQSVASVPSIYFTYTAAVGIAAYLNPDAKSARTMLGEVPPDLHKDLTRQLAGAARWAEAILRTAKGGKFELAEEVRDAAVVSRDEVFIPHLLLTIEAAKTATSYKADEQLILSALETLTEVVESKKQIVFRDIAYYIVSIKGKKIKYEDRTLTYLATAALAWGHAQLPDDHALKARTRAAVAVLVKEILADRASRDAPVWSRDGFEIYRTQRALEALTYVAMYVDTDVIEDGLQQQESWLIDAISKALSDEKVVMAVYDLVSAAYETHKKSLTQPDASQDIVRSSKEVKK